LPSSELPRPPTELPADGLTRAWKNAPDQDQFFLLAVVLVTAAVLRRSLRPRGAGRLRPAAATAGAIDVTASICDVAATRTGRFGLAVVLA
jgi:hypothetical protein